MRGRALVTFVLGVVMFALGAFVSVRPLWTHGQALTGTRWLDVTFAVVFMVRGWMNVRSALKRSSTQPVERPGPQTNAH